MTPNPQKIALSPQEVTHIRQDFPILNQSVHGRPLVYLDSAATSQKPQVVLDAIQRYYVEQNANVHRGVHYLSELATREYEDARVKLQHFINAAESHEIIYTRGTTESINLVAHSFGRKFVKEGDEIIISAIEHHSNIVPWQLLCEQMGATLRVIPINDAGELLVDEFARCSIRK
jgi:cysteine desulfurase/selenocysteine lyase